MKTEHEHTRIYNKIHKFILKIEAKFEVTYNNWLFEKTCSGISMHRANRFWKSELKRMISLCFKSKVMIPKWCQWYHLVFLLQALGHDFYFCSKDSIWWTNGFGKSNLYKIQRISIKSFFPIIWVHLVCVHTK